MSPRIEKYREYYKTEQWKKERIDLLLQRGMITQEEYDYIISD